MATEAVTAREGSRAIEATGRPYARSWIDVVFGWMSALPGPTWLAYLVLIIPSVALANSAPWLSGLTPWGELDPCQVSWGTLTVGMLAGAHRVRNVAGASFDRFRPALGDGVADPERIRYELTVMPAIPVAVITVLLIAITPPLLMADPETGQAVGLHGAGLIARIVAEGGTSAIFLAVVYQAVRQLRRVNRLHTFATDVDPFRPIPLHAFSRLTAQVGIVLVLFVSAGLVINLDALGSSTAVALWAPWIVGTPLVAAITFIVPLLGMHGRLETERDRLEAAADGRMRALISELNEAIDARTTDRIDGLDRAISALRHEREILSKLPTWPWSTGTIRGFGSALLLPIALFLVQRYLGEFLG